GVVEQAPSRLAECLEGRVEVRLREGLEQERAARGAQPLVDGDQVAAELVAAGRREQAQPLGLARREKLLEGAFEGLTPEHGALFLVELAEVRVDADCERMRAQQSRAEAVDGRDPGA